MRDTIPTIGAGLMLAIGCIIQDVSCSHQCSQYTSEQFKELLKEQGITCSMSRAGEVWDNSAMESFFSALKTEVSVASRPH